MENQSKQDAAIGEVMEFLQEHVATKEDIEELKAQMVTKDYLDEKLSDLRGDLVVSMRKEDRKVRRLIELLRDKKILGEPEVGELLSMEPFPG